MEKFTDTTTAGIHWRQYSQQGFLTDRKKYFYIRLYWGRTFILDVHDAKLETDAEVAKRVEQQVLRQTKDLIETFNGEYYSNCRFCQGRHLRPDLTEGVFVIKKHGLPEGKKILKEVLKRTDDNRNNDLKRYLDRVKTKRNP